MSESGSVSERIRTRHTQINGWYILVGVLLLVWLITALVGGARFNGLKKAVAQERAAMQAMMNKERQNAVLRQGEGIARSFSLTNPLYLTDEGLRAAQQPLAALMKDAHIAYIALVDMEGEVRVTTDLRLIREKFTAKRLTDLERGTPIAGADAEFVGPIGDLEGNQIGVVRVGLVYNPKTTKPAAAPKAK